MKECKKIERVTLPLSEESRSSPPVQLKLPTWTGHLCWKGEQGASIYFTEHQPAAASNIDSLQHFDL